MWDRVRRRGGPRGGRWDRSWRAGGERDIHPMLGLKDLFLCSGCLLRGLDTREVVMSSGDANDMSK